MRIPNRSTLPDQAYLSGTICSNQLERPAFATPLLTE